MMRAFLTLATVCIFAEGVGAQVLAQASSQQFEIVDAAGLVSAHAEIKRGRLVVLDGNGERSDYSREPRYDSADQQYVGYFNANRNRVLRFPRSGSGNLFTADLSEAAPQFRRTVRSVRPARASSIIPTDRPVPLPIGPNFAGPNFAGPGYVDPGYVDGDYGNGYGSLLPSRRSIAHSQSVLIDSEVVANPPLPPVEVMLFNSGNRDLQVQLVGLASGVQGETIRLAPGERRPVRVQRDSGGQRIDYYRVISSTGEFFNKQIAVPIAASPLYEVVAHEWAMQSIAIDRTGKSPSAIEDINYQGKGIGRFPLPAGANLTSTTIDVKRAAQAAGNPGSVAPLVPAAARDERASDEPLDRVLREVLEQQRRAVKPL